MSQKCKNCFKATTHYKLTYKDFLMLKRLGKQQKTILANVDLTGAIIFKPWGYEYLVMKCGNSCAWMLHINQHFGTSLHCHETKQTIICVVSGILMLTTATRRQLMESGDMAVIDKKVFHAVGALTDDTRIVEIETPSYKPDAVRAVDFWGRQGQAYESKCLVLQNPPEKYEEEG